MPVEGMGEVTFRPLREEDLPMLQAWIGRAHVREWWAGDEPQMSPEEFRAHYLPRVMAGENVAPFIAMPTPTPATRARSAATRRRDSTRPGRS